MWELYLCIVQLKYVQLNLFKIIIECAFCVSVMNASIDNVLNAGAGHTPQLLRQYDTVFKANKLLSVALPLNIVSKLYFCILAFTFSHCRVTYGVSQLATLKFVVAQLCKMYNVSVCGRVCQGGAFFSLYTVHFLYNVRGSISCNIYTLYSFV